MRSRWKIVPGTLALSFASFLRAADPAKPALPIHVEQIISREDPSFDCAKARMSVGRDGRVYLASAATNDRSYILRVSSDGPEKRGVVLGEAITGAAANQDGIVASANAHFLRQVILYDRDLQKLGSAPDFLDNDQVGYDAPGCVEAGESGDFYGLDQHRDRIIRIDGNAKIISAYPLPHIEGHAAQSFRVCEKTQSFYVLFYAQGEGECIGFDGKVRWKKTIGVSNNTYEGNNGGFDLDGDGALYAMSGQDHVIHKFDKNGDAAGQIDLQIPPDRRPVEVIRELRIFNGEALIRSRHPSELFQIYELSDGKFKRAVEADHERLSLTAAGGPWTAGKTVGFKIEFDGGGRRINPRWRVWARPFGVLDYRELKLQGEKLQVPTDYAGLYQVKVTPEANPWQQATTPCEYKVETVVEVRKDNAAGGVAVATPLNRIWFGRGEEIPFTVHFRGADPVHDLELTVSLTDGAKALASTRVKLNGTDKQFQFTLPKSLTARLRPGRYTLSASSDEYTCISQPIMIGPGVRDPGFLTTVYGDYAPTYPDASPTDAPDVAGAASGRVERLGFNLMVDRLGHPGQLRALSIPKPSDELEALRIAIAADPKSAAADKLMALPSLLQQQCEYGANGVRQMAILMANDAGLPIGDPGFDGRKTDQILKDLTSATRSLAPFPSFRGWVWASNWWVFDKRGAAAARTPEEKSACEQALKQASATGAWDPVLDKVAGYRLSYAVDTQAIFNEKLKELAPAAVTASACPFRNVESYPPVTLANVDETDLQAQWEQIAVPYHGALNVDFYKRPGKKAWAHPELWNDAGTGDQILPTLWQTIMRGSDGVGCSGTVPPWENPLVGNTDDPRLSWNGTASVYRALNGVLKQYGPWLGSLSASDKVAIIADGRMFKIDAWYNITGRHFARVMEAYISCLHAHLPASIVFAEDLNPDTLKAYKAVLLVDQTVEMEPSLAATLEAAKGAGVAVLADGTCRAELVKGYAQLGLSFDKLEKDPSGAGDDNAYFRFAAYANQNVPALRKALGAVKPAAEVENPEVLISERKAGAGKYLFVVNNSVPDELDPAHLWRVTLAVTSLVPQVAPVKLDLAAGEAVYDVFAARQVEPADGVVQADCRNMPARIFAILPSSIARVQLKSVARSAPGHAVPWEVQVQDAEGKPIDAAIPLRVRLLAEGGGAVEEKYISVGAGGASGTFMLPLNHVSGDMSIEAVELFSGRRARTPIFVPEPSAKPMDLAALPDLQAAPPIETENRTSADHAASDFTAAEDSFGPHVRDLVITSGGKLGVLNTMNWDHNLYGLDLETGAIRWRQRVGQYFAFDPTPLSNGAMVQGFDLKSPQGYHLYHVDADGTLERRFALYGLPQRLPHRFVPDLVRDHINSFAAGDDGKWVATAGDMGLAVWSDDGKLLWRQDWYKQKRHPGKVVAIDAATLLVIEGITATAYGARDGSQKWQMPVGRSGEIRSTRVSTDHTTIALSNNADGGTITILRDGKIARVIATTSEDLSLSDDGSLIAVVSRNLLKLYSLRDGLQWVFNGDDAMHFPRFSNDKRIVASSSIGTVYVMDLDGKLIMEKDLQAVAAPTWLPNGDLVLATWEGSVSRLDKMYLRKWLTHLAPEARSMQGKLLADDHTPTVAISDWGNATDKPADAGENLLTKTTPLIRLVPSGDWGGTFEFVNSADQKVAMLYDGKATAPPRPWIPWSSVGFFAETSPINYILIDAFRTRMKVTGVTLIEDPNHPESWLRDATIDYWDAGAEKWLPIQPLLSNSAVHTHMFAKPVEAARFRIVLPWGDCGNLRLAQIVFHGEPGGCSHPDVVAKNPVAVLFDEQDDIKGDLIHSGNGLSFSFQGAYSGGRCLTLTTKPDVAALAAPLFQQQFNHTIRNWDFEIVEKPEPGQYRYLQFAWRGDDKTRGIGLSVGAPGSEQRAFTAGSVKLPELTTGKKFADSVSREWTTVRVDLYEAFGKPARIRAMSLLADGGAAQFDQVVLGRTEGDLPTPIKH